MEAVRSAERERFLDVVRTAAILRVIVWHAFGAAAITYVLSAVPAMFFVTGSLLARSIDAHGASRTVVDRLRRMLPPLWLFAAVAFTVMAVADRVSESVTTAVPRDAMLFWLVPLDDPTGSSWEGGWLSSPLWYLRALLWVILAAPLLLRVVRRAPRATLAALAAVVVALDLAARHPTWPLQQTRTPWLVGDFALYAIFVTLGFLHRDGHLARVARHAWAGVAVVAAGAAAAWVLTQPVHRHIVNDSHPMHLLVGVAWLATALAFAPAIERFGTRPRVDAFVHTMNSRSLTVYLWHSSAIIVAYQLLWRIPFALPTGAFSALLLALTAIGTVTLVAAFGWIEDVAARRTGALWPGLFAHHPRRSGSVALGGVVVFVLAGLGAQTLAPAEAAQVAAASLAAPSQQPPTPTAGTAPTESSAIAVLATKNGAVRDEIADAVDDVVDRWLVRTGVEGAQVAVTKGGTLVYSGAVGTDTTGRPLLRTDRFDIWSITKTYTAWIVYQLEQRGALSLDAPLPAITALPSLDGSRFTVRMLLDHSTGLVPYRDTAAYLAAPNAVTDPVGTMQGVIAEPLRFTPGSRHEYSSSNYLVLGLLVEQLTGRTFDQLLREWILAPYSLDATTHDPPTAGNPNFSTGGVITDIVDMVTWADLYLARHVAISPTNYALMNTIDPASAMGAGVIGYCPCATGANGTTTFAATGCAGSTTEIQYSAADGITIAVNLSRPVWEPATRYAEVVDLFAALRTVVGSLVTTPSPR